MYRCIEQIQQIVTEPSAIAPTTTYTAPLCNGDNNGSITANATGGTAPYQYSLDNATWQTANTFNGLTAGTYTIYVQDDNGCIEQIQQIVTEPAVLIASISTYNNVSCNGDNDGSITANATGGTAPYQYSLDNATWQTANTFNGLTAGTYTIYVQDDNGCIDV